MSNRKHRLFRSGLSTIFLGLVVLLHAIGGYAESLPTRGTFRGVYHVNRAGVGKFSFFIIPKALKKQMASHEGRYIELEVLKARQPINPGPAIVDQIGKVARLSGPSLGLKLQPVPSAAKAGKVIDVIYSLVNVGNKDITIDVNDVQIGVRGYSQPPKDRAQDDMYQTGYTRRQLSFGGPLLQRWNFISPMHPGQRTHFHGGKVLLRPGETAPFVLHGITLKPGQYEVAAIAALRPTKGKRVPVMAAQSFDAPLPRRKRIQDALLDAQAQVTYDDEWLIVDGRIFRKANARVALFALSDRGVHFLPGLVQLYSSCGDLLPAKLDWRRPDGPWRRIQVGREGLRFKFRLRRADRFSRKRITKIGFWTVTDRGIEKLTLADALSAPPQRPLPPWGKTVRGCRLRIRMPRQSIGARQKIRFFFQAESDSKKADTVWIDAGNLKSHVVVKVDGNRARIGTTGISDCHVNHFPFQGEISLASTYKIAPGRHRLQLSVRGDPGIYTNLRGEKFRKFRGILVSNVVEFEVQPEQ